VPAKEGGSVAESGGDGDAKKRKKRGSSEGSKDLEGEKSGEGGRSTPVGGVAGEKKRGRKGNDKEKEKEKDGDATKEVKEITAVGTAVEVKAPSFLFTLRNFHSPLLIFKVSFWFSGWIRYGTLICLLIFGLTCDVCSALVDAV
jgi:hypothetical protein